MQAALAMSAVVSFWALGVLMVFELPTLPPSAARVQFLAKAGCVAAIFAFVGVGILDRLGSAATCFVASMTTHLIIGVLLAWLQFSPSKFASMQAYIKLHVVTLATFVAIVAGARVVIDAWGTRRLFRGVLAILLASTASTVLAPAWMYAGLPRIPGLFLHPTRFFGPFVSPMVGAFAGGATAVLGMALLDRVRAGWTAYVAMSVGLMAVILSLSKGGAIGFAAVVALFLLRGASLRRLRLLGWSALVLAGAWLGLPAIVSSGVLSTEQVFSPVGRWYQVMDLLSGDWNFGAMSGRNVIWRLAWETYVQSPILGVGFGEMAALDFAPLGGLHDIQRAGAHNHYLALGGEAGIIPVLFFMLGLLALARPMWALQRSYATDAVAGVAVLFLLLTVAEGHVFRMLPVSFIVAVSCALVADATARERRTTNVRRVAPGAGRRLAGAVAPRSRSSA